eukprot:3624167-Pyramimonas_sp.AAC.1
MLDRIPEVPDDPDKRNFQAAVLRAIEKSDPPESACQALIPRLQCFFGRETVRQEMGTMLMIRVGRLGQ